MNPWDLFRKRKFIRFDRVHNTHVTIDRGVNFFVQVLEVLGAETVFSCEGHPSGFYITFVSSYELAQRVKTAGYFTVEIEGEHYWSIRLPGHMPPKNERAKRRTLRWAAEAWTKKLLPPPHGTTTQKPEQAPEQPHEVLRSDGDGKAQVQGEDSGGRKATIRPGARGRSRQNPGTALAAGRKGQGARHKPRAHKAGSPGAEPRPSSTGGGSRGSL